jgi:16S rRNA (guanine966-N2)-methyltransferase
MRVIGGSRKGSVLKAPAGLATRPLLARIKKSLFSILHPRLSGARFLDLFAGTGAVGIEALSRGAASCVFVERDSRCVDFIRENLGRLTLDQHASVLRGDVFKTIAHFHKAGEQFDVVFIGPPYGHRLEHRTMQAVADSGVLAADGIVVVQSRKNEDLSDHYSDLVLARKTVYGDTILRFYEARTVSIQNSRA